jgi:hypothetical protein
MQFLYRVVSKESKHLWLTDQRLFAGANSLLQINQIENDPDLAELVEAFVGRFSRLQDTLGDKLLPVLLHALGERTSSAIDNLDLAERLNLIESADEWMTIRNLRNQMVHEYVEDQAVLLGALHAAHGFVPTLIAAFDAMLNEATSRGWVDRNPQV